MTKSLLFLSLFALASCQSPPSLQGNWSIDVDAMIERAKASGIPDSAAPRIREIYEDGLLEITPDTLVIRVSGVSDAIARNYKIVSKTEDCYNLEIAGSSATHSYCLEGENLVVLDSSARIAIVYDRL
jgi:hypothetical protein